MSTWLHLAIFEHVTELLCPHTIALLMYISIGIDIGLSVFRYSLSYQCNLNISPLLKPYTYGQEVPTAGTILICIVLLGHCD